MDKMTSFAIFLVSCWVLGGATTTQDGQLYSNFGVNGKMFKDNITFESTASSARQCALQCNQQDSCVTFTFHQNTCRGHGTPMTSCSSTQPAPGARSFERKGITKPPTKCEGTGAQRLSDASIGLESWFYCDDGWLVFQKREGGSVDFFRNWNDYVIGFGNVNTEYWLGLDILHCITTSSVNYELRVDLMSFDGTKASVVYSNFTVGPAADNYRLNYDSFLGGSTGNSLFTHRGMQFSTLDADRDNSSLNCAAFWQGGWWYNDCHNSNLNGIFKRTRSLGYDGIVWETFDGWYSLKSCQMMIRPAGRENA